MKPKFAILLVLVIMLGVQMACNLPASGGENPLPASNQTLTALFAVTLVETATPTLPPVVTATQSGEAAAASPTPVPTNTQASAPAATATVAPPTNTPLPPVTATIPSARPRGGVTAKFITKALAIDGDWSEWKDIATEYPATKVTFGGENWDGQDDLAGSFYVGWDNDYLYLAVKVRDDVYVQNAFGASIYKGDSIEILLDTNIRDDYYVTQLSPDDFQLGFSPGHYEVGKDLEAYLWYPSGSAGNRTNIKMASLQQEGVYRFEAAIPWSVFGTKPAAGDHMGFVLSVSDDDSSSGEDQESMVSNVTGRRLTDPTTWGDIYFTR